MPIDPAGTKPGLAPQEPEIKTVNVRCKRSGCDSIEAVEMSGPYPMGRHLFRCAKCNMTWGVAVGGVFDL